MPAPCAQTLKNLSQQGGDGDLGGCCGQWDQVFWDQHRPIQVYIKGATLCSKIPWQIITINNCFSKDRSQSRVLDVVRSVTGAFNRSHFKLNRSLKTFSLAAWTLNNLSVRTQQKLENFLTCSLNKFSPPLFSGLRLSQELPLGSCCNIRRCLELFLQKWRWLSEIKITFNFFGKRPSSSKIQNHISTDGVSSFF